MNLYQEWRNNNFQDVSHIVTSPGKFWKLL
jgi:hypothetical protein